MTDRFFDIRFTIHVNGFEKTGWSRVWAEDPLEAVICAIDDEVHVIDSDEVESQVREQYKEHKSLTAIRVEDDYEFIYEIDDIAELKSVPVKVNGKWTRILVPIEGLETRSRLPGALSYFHK